MNDLLDIKWPLQNRALMGKTQLCPNHLDYNSENVGTFKIFQQSRLSGASRHLRKSGRQKAVHSKEYKDFGGGG